MKNKSNLIYASKPIYKSVIKRRDMQPPTLADIKYTKELFIGFDIHEDIPEFKTKGELYNWRDRVIRSIWNE